MKYLTPAAMLAAALSAQAQTAPTTPAPPATSASAPDPATLAPVVVKASADASAEGLSPAFPGGQVARGGRAGVLGTKDAMDTPVNITAYTNELIQDRQARSVGDVLKNDPSVRIARGFGNFQESYFIRGFILNSDDVAYNGLYSLLPRQYISSQLFERVEVLRGASAFLSGANPGGGGIGGAINLLPKRADNEDLNRVTLGAGPDGYGSVSADVSRRFGPDNATGLRINAGYRNGGTGVDDENNKNGVFSAGLDWRSRDVRLSGDIGFQDNQLSQTRPNVDVSAVTVMPAAPDASKNYAQPWSYSNERDLFGTLRAEWDITPTATGWAAYGLRRSREANSLANVTLTNGATGAGTFSRFDNTRRDDVDTGELGLRGTFQTGSVGHEWVTSLSAFQLDKRAAYAWDFFNTSPTNIYAPVYYPQPAFSGAAFRGNDLDSPGRTGRTKLTSLAAGDTLLLLEDDLRVTLGARWQKLEDITYAYGTGALDPDAYYEKSRVSPMAGVVYRIIPALSVYGNYIEGLTKGPTTPSVGGVVGQSLAPYVSKQKEVGLKYDLGELGGSLAFFSTDKPRAFAGTQDVQGKDRHRGIELTAYGRVIPSVKLLGGVTWLDAKQVSTGDPATEGKRTLGIPRWQASVGPEWQLPGVQGFALDALITYTGARYINSANAVEAPDWTRLDLGARYDLKLAQQLVTLRLRVENVTDRNYWTSAGGYPEQSYLVAGNPRTFNVSASVDF